MQLNGPRKKKLIVAFHFHIAAPRGWDCDECRKQHLEVKRRCGWVPESQLTESKPVWIRRQVETDCCPKWLINAQSLEWLEAFAAWRGGYLEQGALTAKQIEAFQVLQNELVKETHYAKQTTADNISRAEAGRFR